MMKKAVHITFLCLFFLLGTQCNASNKKNSSFTFFETSAKQYSKECRQSLSKKEFSVANDTFDKVYKKKRLVNPFHNSIARLSKCYSSSLILGAIPYSKFVFQKHFESLVFSSEHSLHNSFCPKGKLLSIFYSFQAFW